MTNADRIRKLLFPATSSGCMPFTGMLNSGGYGVVFVDGSHVGAHRYSYEYHCGSAAGLCVRHTCDNPSCVNPEHLRIGTHQDNMDDKVARSRQVRGENHSHARLNAERVAEIFALCEAGETRTLVASKMGVSQSHVSAILLGKKWGHLGLHL